METVVALSLTSWDRAILKEVLSAEIKEWTEVWAPGLAWELYNLATKGEEERVAPHGFEKILALSVRIKDLGAVWVTGI